MGKKQQHDTDATPQRPAIRGDRSSLEDFKGWMAKAGITWDTSLIQLRAGDQSPNDASGHGVDMNGVGAVPPVQGDAPWAVFAVSDIPEGRVLATIPRHTVLSAANSGLADVLALEQLGGGLALVAAVMYEAARGSGSKWYGYLSSLPPLEYLPVFWSEEELQRLEGTDVGGRAKADREAMAADFEAELAPLLFRYPKRLGPLTHGWNVGAFMRAASWVASRAFYVDEHHGDALVPLADVFNHKAARVDLRGRGGGWADGFEVAEHADARQQQHEQTRRHGRGGGGGGGGGSESLRKRKRKGDRTGSDTDDGDVEMAAAAEEEEEEEGEEGDVTGDEHSNDHDDGDDGDDDEEDEEAGEEEEAEDEEESERGIETEEEEGAPVKADGGDRGSGRAASAAAAAAAASKLDRDPGDDGNDPWPPPPPPPPLPPPSSLCLPAAAASQVDAGGGGGGVLGSRWEELAAAAVDRGGRNLHLDIGICAGERGGCEVLDIVAAQPLTKGAEIFNTYGEHGNSELVNKYGFALPYNPFDELLIGKGAVMAAVAAVVGQKEAKKRFRFLEQYSDLLSAEEEPFLLLPPRHVNTALFVALWVLLAETQRTEQWASLEDALKPLRKAWRLQRDEKRQQQQQQLAAVAVVTLDARAAVAAGENAGKGEVEAERGGGQGGEGESKGTKRRRRGAGDGGDGAAGGRGGNGEGAGGGGGGGISPPMQGAGRRDHSRNRRGREKGERGRGWDGREEEEEEEEEEEDDLPEDVEIQGRTERSRSSTFESKSGLQNGLDLNPAARSKAKMKQRKVTDGSGAGAGVGARAGGGGGDNDRVAAAAPSPPPEMLWTDAMRSVLRSVVSERLRAYPTSLEQDEQELETGKQEEGGGTGIGVRKGGEGTGRGGAGGAVGAAFGLRGGITRAAEAEVAWRSALLLRVGEKRLLAEALRHLR